MKSQKVFLAEIIKLLETAGIEYMIAGSVASSFHGRPRSTQDVDIVIKTTRQQLLSFIQSLGKAFYSSQQAATEAFENHSMFNIIDIANSHKADIIIIKDRPFSAEEFHRKIKVKMIDAPVELASPEDTILSKLEWSKESGSERQFDDALGVAIVQWNKLDLEYLQKWSRQLDIKELLEKLLDQAKRLQA